MQCNKCSYKTHVVSTTIICESIKMNNFRKKKKSTYYYIKAIVRRYKMYNIYIVKKKLYCE